MSPLTNTANIFPIVTHNNTPSPSGTQTQILEYQHRIIPYSKALFDVLWTTSIDGMRLTDENGIIKAVNKAYCSLVGMTEKELIDQSFTVVYASPEDRLRLFSTYQMVFQIGMAQTVFEHHTLLQSGKHCDNEIISMFVDSEKGKRLLLTQFRNFGIHQKIENELRESEAKYRGLFAQSIQPMFECTLDGRLTNANNSLLRLLGYKSFSDIFNLNLLQDVYVNADERRDLLKILEVRGYIRNIEIQIKRRNGSQLTVLEHAHALRDDSGTMIGVEGVLEDITAKKAMDKTFQSYVLALEESKKKLSDLNAQKNKLLSILSHDLRSPFTSILGFCEILIKENDSLSTQERIQFLGYVQEAAKDQLRAVNNLLDWTRIESGRVKTDMRNLDVYDIVQRSVNTLLGLAKKKNIHLTNHLKKGTFIYGDPELLIQLFTNLLGNALKFTPSEGGIFIEVEKRDTDKWTIAVRDTGVGIPEQDIPRLFNIDEKYTREGLNGEKGTGLGLPVCYEIVQKHQGSISVQSIYGKGTTFRIQFPRTSFESGKNILIVDDEPGVRILHTKYVQRLCPTFKIIHASDGEEAIDLARSLQPKLIISDHDMPYMNGYELLNRLKTDPSTQDIPVIFITGHDSNAVQDTLRSLGVSEVIIKPVAQDNLESALTKIGVINNCENKVHYN